MAPKGHRLWVDHVIVVRRDYGTNRDRLLMLHKALLVGLRAWGFGLRARLGFSVEAHSHTQVLVIHVRAVSWVETGHDRATSDKHAGPCSAHGQLQIVQCAC